MMGSSKHDIGTMPADLDRLEALGYDIAEGEMDLRAYEVFDRDGKKVGTVESLLASPSQQRAYCAVVDLGSWMQGRRAVIPLGYFGINQVEKRVTVPFSQEQFRGAPQYDGNQADTNRHASYWSGLGASAAGDKSTGMTRDASKAPTKPEPRGRAEGELRVAETEETAQVRKVAHQTGTIGIRKRVETETKHFSTPVSHTDVTVERRAVAPGESYVADPNARPLREGETLRVPIISEEVVVDKAARVTGEVVLRSKTETEVVEQDVQLRRERVEVDEDVEEEMETPAKQKR